MRDPEFSRLSCPNCNRRYHSEQVAILGMSGDDYLVKGVCSCGLLATFLVRSAHPIRDAITFDDVLAAHEFLKDYLGGIEGLFKKE